MGSVELRRFCCTNPTVFSSSVSDFAPIGNLPGRTRPTLSFSTERSSNEGGRETGRDGTQGTTGLTPEADIETGTDDRSRVQCPIDQGTRVLGPRFLLFHKEAGGMVSLPIIYRNGYL